MIDFNQIPKISKNMKFIEKGDSYLVIDPENIHWAVVNKTGRKIIELCDSRRKVKDIFQIIKECHILTKSEESEKSISDFLNKLEKSGIVKFNNFETSIEKKSFPVFNGMPGIYFEITKKCNLNCKHCVHSLEERKGNSELSLTEIIDIMEQAYWLSRYKYKNSEDKIDVTLSGGEPLIRADFMNIVNELYNYPVGLCILTNGILINKRVADFLKDFKPEIQISLDGSNSYINDYIRGKGSFDATMKNIKLLLKSGLSQELSICVTPSKINLHNINEIISLSYSLGVSHIHFSHPLIKKGNAVCNWNEIALSLEDEIYLNELVESKNLEMNGRLRISGLISCRKNLDSASFQCPIGKVIKIDSLGNCYPCQLFFEPQFCLGNCRTTRLKEMLFGDKLQELKQLPLRRVQKIWDDIKCPYTFFCGGGCFIFSLYQNGSVWKCNSCETWKPSFHKSIDLKTREATIVENL